MSEEQQRALMAELIAIRIRLTEIHNTLHALLGWIFIVSIFFAFK